MKRVVPIMVREFLATAMTKSFIIGAFIVPPGIMAIMAVAMPLLLTQKAPKIEGTLAVIDRSGAGIAEVVAKAFSPEGAEQRRGTQRAEIEEVRDQMEALAPGMGGQSEVQQKLLQGVLEGSATLTVEILPPDTDVAEASVAVRGKVREGGRLALLSIDADAVEPGDDGEYGSYTLHVRSKFDERNVAEIQGVARDAILSARVTTALNIPIERFNSLRQVSAPKPLEVTETGEQRTSLPGLSMILPFSFVLVTMMGVMIGGQYLLTTTIEEKSSRVVEVLLSAVSPTTLMSGKILGQMLVSATLLVIYGSIGIFALFMFALSDLVSIWAIVYCVAFFVIAYFTIASAMAAIGSAVSDMREAQAMMTPVILTVMVPYFLGLPIAQNPNSGFAVAMSFIPPFSPFVMMMRVASNDPPAHWQPMLAILIGIVTVLLCFWGAGKIFRIGLLLHGKPPSFGTLLKWIRMA